MKRANRHIEIHFSKTIKWLVINGFAILLVSAISSPACDGDFSKIRESAFPHDDDSGATDGNSSSTDTNGLPTKCKIGDSACREESVLTCLPGNAWFPIFNCASIDFECQMKDDAAMCVLAFQDADSSMDTSTLPSACKTSDSICREETILTCLPGNTWYTIFDCASIDFKCEMNDSTAKCTPAFPDSEP